MDAGVLVGHSSGFEEGLFCDWTKDRSAHQDIAYKNIQGHPQCLKNITTVGLPSAFGIRSFIEVGARVPTTGAAAISTGGGAGVAQDCHDFGTDRFASGLANGRSSFCLLASFGLLFDS